MSEKKKEKLESAGMLVFPFNYEDAEKAGGLAKFLKEIVPVYEIAKKALMEDSAPYGGLIGPANIMMAHSAISELEFRWSGDFPSEIARAMKYEIFTATCYVRKNFTEDKEGAMKSAAAMAKLTKNIVTKASLLGNSLGCEVGNMINVLDDDDFSCLTIDAAQEFKGFDSAVVIVQDGEYHENISEARAASFLNMVETSIGFREKLYEEWGKEDTAKYLSDDDEEDENDYEKAANNGRKPGDRKINVKVIKPEKK